MAARVKVPSEIALESSIDVRRRCRSTNVPKAMPEIATSNM